MRFQNNSRPAKKTLELLLAWQFFYLFSSKSNTRDVEGPWRVPCHFKKLFKGLRYQDEGVAGRPGNNKIVLDERSLICLVSWFLSPKIRQKKKLMARPIRSRRQSLVRMPSRVGGRTGMRHPSVGGGSMKSARHWIALGPLIAGVSSLIFTMARIAHRSLVGTHPIHCET